MDPKGNREWTRIDTKKISRKDTKERHSTADESAAAPLPPSSLVPGTMADKMARLAADLRR